MEISTAPYLLKNLQPKAHTKEIQMTITLHTRTSSLKNYMPPKYIYQKAENKTIGASFAHSLPLSLLDHTQVQVTSSFTAKVG